MKLKVALLVFSMVFCLTASALDRWAALSQIESGDDDKAVGRMGEISRYQMLPNVWAAFASEHASWENPKDALAVAKEAMKKRCVDFEKNYRRPPTDFEFYVLWNAPAQIERPGNVVTERAKRFCNLVTRNEKLAETPKR